jgi:hypothetical protein
MGTFLGETMAFSESRRLRIDHLVSNEMAIPTGHPNGAGEQYAIIFAAYRFRNAPRQLRT